MYSSTGRPSIPPEKLLRALLLQMLYSVRSERLLMEEPGRHLLPFQLFCWTDGDNAARLSLALRAWPLRIMAQFRGTENAKLLARLRVLRPHATDMSMSGDT
jgi:hypothetical protein